MEADYARLRAAGYDGFRSPDPIVIPWGPYRGGRACYLRDPDGSLDRADGGTAGWSGLERVGEAGHEGRSGRGVRGPVPEPNNDGKLRSLCLVRIETEDGLVGWGEAISGAPVVSLAVAFVVERRLAPWSWAAIRATSGAWSAMRDATYWDGNGGLVSFGISAIDMALWDIAGKAAGQPLWALLGGRRREAVPACASTILATDDLDRVGREFSGFVADGYRFVKGGWGHDLSIAFGLDERRDLAVARAVREAIGPEVEMIVDVVALAGWDSSHAIRMARQLDDACRLYWLEDPLVEQDLEGYARLHAAVDVRICTGEKGWHAAHFRGLIDSAAVDGIMVDPGKAEGVTGAWGIITMAAAAAGPGTPTHGRAPSTRLPRCTWPWPPRTPSSSS